MAGLSVAERQRRGQFPSVRHYILARVGRLGAGENPPHHRRRQTPARVYPETDSLIDEYQELSALAPSEIRRYCGSGKR